MLILVVTHAQPYFKQHRDVYLQRVYAAAYLAQALKVLLVLSNDGMYIDVITNSYV